MKNKQILEDRFCNNCNNDVCCCIIRTQETLKEACARLLNFNDLDSFRDHFHKQELYIAFIVGIKYQQERSYSEEDIALAFNEGQAYSVTGKLVDGKEWVKAHKKEWFEQFKNK
jgi:hypothetical protein